MCYSFLALNFSVGFFSDLVLNILSRSTFFSIPSIRALYSYFQHYNSPLLTAIYAGLTVIFVLAICMFFSYYLLGFITPVSLKQLYLFLLLAFPIGYIADILIYKWQIFGPYLNPFYKIAGAGLGGAVSLLFSIVVSFFIEQFIL